MIRARGAIGKNSQDFKPGGDITINMHKRKGFDNRTSGGAGKLRVNLRVQELQGVVRSYSEQLRVLQDEIKDLELEQKMDAERDDAIAKES